MEGISVIICCYNSEKRLPETLYHLSKQEVNDFDWEVIIVDNNSKDDTITVSYNKWSQYSSRVPFKVVTEIEQGLSSARNKGIKEAIYDLIIFCDDDNWLDSNYLSEAYRILKKNDKIGACGGKGTAVFETQIKPSWFSNDIEGAYALGAQGTFEGPIPIDRSSLYGAGIVIKRSVLLDIFNDKYVPILSDRKGSALSAGGDSEISILITSRGYELWYSPCLKFKHFLTKERLNEDYLKRMIIGFGKSAPYINIYHSYSSNKKFWYIFYRYWCSHILLHTIVYAKNFQKTPQWLKSKDFHKYKSYIKEVYNVRKSFPQINNRIKANLNIK